MKTNLIYGSIVAVVSLTLVNCSQGNDIQTNSDSTGGFQSQSLASSSSGPAAVQNPIDPTQPQLVNPLVPANDISEIPTCAQLDSSITQIDNALALFSQMESKYNQLCDAMTFAGGAPAGYISSNVSPTIIQGPGVTDSLNGITVLRSDLYFAHDTAAAIRQSLNDKTAYTLPANFSSNASVTQALAAYRAAMDALPLFGGPIGMQLSYYPQRYMDGLDADALQQQRDDLVARGCK